MPAKSNVIKLDLVAGFLRRMFVVYVADVLKELAANTFMSKLVGSESC